MGLFLRRGRTIFALGGGAVVQLLTPHSDFSLRCIILFLLVACLSVLCLVLLHGKVLMDLHADDELFGQFLCLYGMEEYFLLRTAGAAWLGGSVPVVVFFGWARHGTQLLY